MATASAPSPVLSNPADSIRAAAALGACVVAVAALTWPTAPDMVRQWFTSSAYHHGIFAAPLSIWLILHKSAWPQARGGVSASLACALAGALIWLAGIAGSASIISQAGLVIMLIAITGSIFGDNALKAWAFPLLLLFFMIPAGEFIVPLLQTFTAKFVVAALSGFGMHVSIDGILIRTQAGVFAIAEACAGLRLLTAALMLAATYAYVAFQGWIKRVGFIAFAAVFAIMINAFRAMALIAIPTLTNTKASLGPDHFVIGWVIYLIALFAIIFIGRRFAEKRTFENQIHNTGVTRSLPVIATLCIVAAASAYAHVVVLRASQSQLPSHAVFLNAPGWRILPPPQNWRPAFQSPDRYSAATYDRVGQRVYAAFADYAFDRRNAEIASTANHAWDDDAWDRAGAYEGVIYLFGSTQNRRFDIVAGPENRRLLTLTIYWLDGRVYEDARSLKIAQAQQKLKGQNPAGGVIILAAAYNKSPADALDLLRQFTVDIEKFSEWRTRAGGA